MHWAVRCISGMSWTVSFKSSENCSPCDSRHIQLYPFFYPPFHEICAIVFLPFAHLNVPFHPVNLALWCYCLRKNTKKPSLGQGCIFSVTSADIHCLLKMFLCFHLFKRFSLKITSKNWFMLKNSHILFYKRCERLGFWIQ